MVHVIKVHLEDSKNGNQIRRLAVSSDVASDFKLLKEKIKSLFQLQNNCFEMKWKDSDNDLIHMSSDEELAQALANAEDGLLRIYLYIKEGVQTQPKTPEMTKKIGIEHPLVTCDGCEKDIFGDRYKCLQCKNFDLCSFCNAANKHPDHDFIKLVKPSYIPREWLFCGARKIWKSMFGPAYMMHCHEDKEESKPSTPQNPNGETPRRQCNNHRRMPDLFSTLINGDLSEAQKYITEALETCANFLPAGIEVKLDQKPFRAECKVKPCSKKAKSKKESTETCADTKQDKKVAKPEDKTEQPKKEESAVADPKKEETLPVPTESKKVDTAESILFLPKFESVGLFPVPTQVKDQVSETVPVTESCVDAVPAPVVEAVPAPVVEATERIENKEKSPASDVDSSTCAEGWTFIHEDETNKQEPSCSAEATIENAADAAKDVHYPKLDEIKSRLEEGSVVQTSDPKIINALIKMQAMGFTNEGGWLERLLITKHGNINEALDALYPFTQRQ